MRKFLHAGAAIALTMAALVASAEDPPISDPLRQSRGELLLQIEQLRQETQALRGLMEELSYQLDEMSSDQKTRYLDLDQRLGELVRIQKQTVANQHSAPLATLVDPADGSQAVIEPATAPELSDQDAYKEAFELIRERQFEDALIAMGDFVVGYPDSELVLDANYWRGQVFDALGQDVEAIEEFKNITLVAPDYQRILQVKVKLGKLLIKNQDVLNGQKILQEVIEQAPESVEAGLASRELEKVN